MVPRSWSIQKTKDEFQVWEYIVRQARKLAQEKGILEVPFPNLGKPISDYVKETVLNFYQDDEFSRQIPGKKDCVSIGKNILQQKRLLLCAFKKQHPEIKISFSKFCSLRPKWCILVERSGTHSVCVCAIHQNVSLMLKRVNLEK